jgi:acid phosphatase (class A)
MIKFFLFALVLVSQFSYANTETDSLVRVLSENEIQQIIGDYPRAGSKAYLNDYAVLLKYQATRSKADCEIAQSFVDISLKSLFSSHNGPLTESEARKLSFTLLRRMGEVGVNIIRAKGMYDRPRPYLANPLIKPCIDKESSTSYPSGHALFARVMGKALAKIYPERADAFMKRAELVAESRVLGGVHHPSDIEAGKKLADVIAEELVSSEGFIEIIHETK